MCCFFLFLVETFVVVGKRGASKRVGKREVFGRVSFLLAFLRFIRFLPSIFACFRVALRALFESYASAYFALYPHVLLGGVCARNITYRLCGGLGRGCRATARLALREARHTQGRSFSFYMRGKKGWKSSGYCEWRCRRLFPSARVLPCQPRRLKCGKCTCPSAGVSARELLLGLLVVVPQRPKLCSVGLHALPVVVHDVF